MSLTTPTRTKKPKALPNWLEAVEELAAQIQQWSEAQEWKVTRGIVENVYSPAPAEFPIQWPMLSILTPGGELRLEPIGITLSGKFSTEFYAWPTLNRVLFVYQSDSKNWKIITDSGVPLRQDWNAENFVRLAKDLLSVE